MDGDGRYLADGIKINTDRSYRSFAKNNLVSKVLNDLLLNANKSGVIVIGIRTQVKAYSCGDHVDVDGTLLKLRDNV